MRPADTHCHLQDPRFDGDRGEVLERTLQSLSFAVVVGDDLASSTAACGMARKGIFAAVGVHPYHGESVDAAALGTLRELAARPGVVALGEIGLDYFNEFCPRPAQRAAFAAQLSLAAELGLPVVVHNRDADADSLAMLGEFAPRLSSVIMHCFGSGPATAEACAGLGFYVSFAGNVTFPKAAALRDAARVVPTGLLLAETDAPYLAPQPERGRRCEPAFVRHTLEALALARGTDAETLTETTTHNAVRAFRLPVGAD